MCCTWLTGNTGCKNVAKNRHLHTIAQLCRAVSSHLRHIATGGKNMLNSNMSSTCLHNLANFDPLTAEICWRVWGAPANFNRFHVLPSLLQRWHSPEASETSRDVWPSPGLVHYIYTFLGALAPWQNFAWYNIHFTSKSCILLYWQRYCTALHQRTSAKLCSMVQGMELRNFRRGRHLYSAGRPSCWASADVLVSSFFLA